MTRFLSRLRHWFTRRELRDSDVTRTACAVIDGRIIVGCAWRAAR